MFLEIEGAGKTFVDPEDGREVVALEDVTLSVERNAFVCIVGPSGCGKSTLIHMIAGLEEPSTGTIRVNGLPVTGPGPDRAVVFQEMSLMPWMTVTENIAFGLRAQGVEPERWQATVRRTLDIVGLKGFDRARPFQLSGGMKQKVAVARALALDTDVLLLDEPFASLDEQTRRRLNLELLDIFERDRKTVLFVTHDLEEAVLLADRIVLLTVRPGRIRMDLPVTLPRPRDLFSAEAIAQRRTLLEAMDLCCPPEDSGRLAGGRCACRLKGEDR